MPVLIPRNGFTALRLLERRPTPVGEFRPGTATRIDSPLAQIDSETVRPTRVQILFNKGFQQYNGKWAIVGTTKDEDASTIIPGVTVKLFDTLTDAFLGQTVSDANGVFAFVSGPGSLVPGSLSKTHYCVAYLAGSPDSAGTTRNDLQPASVP